MRAAAPARARTWRTRNARTRLRAAVHMLPCSPAPAETSASRRFAPQVCRRSEIQRIASVSHCCLPPSCAAGSSAPLRVNRSAVLLCTWRAHTAFSVTERSHTACSHGMLTHSVRTPERPASPRLAVAPTHSLLLAPQARHGFPTRSSRFPRCRGRKGAGLPPAPQLRVPRSTAGSEVSSVLARQAHRDALGVPSSPPTRSAAHSWRTQVTLEARCCLHRAQPTTPTTW